MHLVTSCFGAHYLAFLAVLLRSLRQTNPDTPVTVVYSDLPEKKLAAVAERNSNISFVAVDDLPKLSGTNRRIGQKMDLWLQAYRMIDSDLIVFLDCDMIVRKKINFENDPYYNALFTSKDEDVPINTGFAALRKSDCVEIFLDVWRSTTNEICSSPDRLAQACDLAGGADQYALLEILEDFRPTVGSRTINFDACELIFRFVPCADYNETNLVPLNGPAKVLHYKGRWHRILLKGKGHEEYLKKDSANYMALWQLWQDMLHVEEREIGCRLLPWKARYRLAKSRLFAAPAARREPVISNPY